MPRNKTTAKKTTTKGTTARKVTARTSSAGNVSMREAAGKTAANKTKAKNPAATKITAGKTTTKQVKRGDLIVIDSPKVGSQAREGEVLQVLQGGLSVSYRIRWTDGNETLISPVLGSARFVRP